MFNIFKLSFVDIIGIQISLLRFVPNSNPIVREFKDVVFEDVVFDNNSCLTLLYIVFDCNIYVTYIIIKHHIPELPNCRKMSVLSGLTLGGLSPCTARALSLPLASNKQATKYKHEQYIGFGNPEKVY